MPYLCVAYVRVFHDLLHTGISNRTKGMQFELNILSDFIYKKSFIFCYNTSWNNEMCSMIESCNFNTAKT